MQEPSHRRHDISDNAWERLEPFLLGRKGTWGGNARDNRQFINAVFWILRTGALISKFILTRLERVAATKTWAGQKGAQLKDTFGRGCTW